MKRVLIISLVALFTACQKQEKAAIKYQTRDYVTVGKMFPSVKPPYVIDVSNGKKRLVFVGCEHVYGDTTHPEFAKIEELFADLKPQIAFNEGGQVSRVYSSKTEGILKNGESGMLKFCSDKAGIKMMSGDILGSLEYKMMLKKVPREELYLYYAMERIIGPYMMGAYREKSFEENVKIKVPNWFMAEGFPLAKNERDLAYIKTLYKKYIGKDFDIKTADIEAFDYVNDNCKFCAIGRISKEVRDSVLLSKIDAALDQHDRVIVTFGHGHALAVEPALKAIVEKKRD